MQAAVIVLYSLTRVVLPEDPNRAYPYVTEKTLDLDESMTFLGTGPMLSKNSFWHIAWERIQREPQVILLDTLGRASSTIRLPGNTDVRTLTLRDVDEDGLLEVLYTRIWPPVSLSLRGKHVVSYDSVWVCVRDERQGEVVLDRVNLSSLGANQVILPDERLINVRINFLDNVYETVTEPEYIVVFVETQFFTSSRRRLYIFATEPMFQKVAELPIAQRVDRVVWIVDEEGASEIILSGEFPGNGVGVSRPLRGRGAVTRMVRTNDSAPAMTCLGLDGTLKWTLPLGVGRYSAVVPGVRGDDEVVGVLLRSAQDPGISLQRVDTRTGMPLALKWYPNAAFAYTHPSDRMTGSSVAGIVQDKTHDRLIFLNSELRETAEISAKPSLVGLQSLPSIRLGGGESLIPLHVEGSPVSLLFNNRGKVRASVPGYVLRAWTPPRSSASIDKIEVFGDGQLWFGRLKKNDFLLWRFWPYRWLILMLLVSNGLTFALMVIFNSWTRYRRLRLELERIKNMIARTTKGDEHLTTVSQLQRWLQERRDQTEALRMFDAALQSINVAVMNLNLQGIVKSANARAVHLLGGKSLEDRRFSSLFNEVDTVEEMLGSAPGRGSEERVLTVAGETVKPENTLHVTLHPLTESDSELDGWLVMLEPHRISREASFTPADLPLSLGRYGMIGLSPQMNEVYRQIEDMRDNEATVLIVGESGTGKEMVAAALHRFGKRSEGPFVRVNCAALSETLLESELFGHVRGAFTGAYRGRVGRFEAAANGTILLDEIGELPPNLQVKLLRVLQEREIERVGDQKSIPINARIIAATNQDLERAVESGRFRQDLYFRLNVLRIALPPLRDRSGDVALLVDSLLGELAEANGRDKPKLDRAASAALERYHWPGNVRELHNCLERAMILAREGTILMEHLPVEIRNPSGGIRFVSTPEEREIGLENEASEEAGTRRALESTNWNVSRAAKLLGVSRTTIYRNMQKYRLRRPDRQEPPKSVN